MAAVHCVAQQFSRGMLLAILSCWYERPPAQGRRRLGRVRHDAQEELMKRMGHFTAVALPMLFAAVAYAGPAPQQSGAAHEREVRQEAGEARQETREAGDRARDTANQAGGGIRDSWITMKLHSQFVPEDVLDGSDIDVRTRNRVVTLTGTVPTAAARARAVEIAKETEGVAKVNDRLRIGSADRDRAEGTMGRTADDDIVGRDGDRDVAGRRPNEVDDARESGREAGERTRETAREAGRETRETVGTAGRAVTDGWIKSKIYAEMMTEDALEDSDVSMNVRRGVVTLNGTVRTEAARERAAAIAKDIEGVKNVNNKLKVRSSNR
jgi:osmotically-inducible protein OsmY